MLIELISLDRTAEALRAIIGSKSKISGRRGRPTNHSFSHKTRVNDLSHDIKSGRNVKIVFS